MVFSKFPIENFFEMEYQNVLAPSPLLKENIHLQSEIIDQWDGSNQLLASFHDRLYYRKGGGYWDSKSWDLNTGEFQQHANFVEEFIIVNFAVTQVNGKLWRSGGLTEENEVLKETYFLSPDFHWMKGPNLPAVKEAHTKVTISKTKVVIFGGNARGFGRGTANAVWLYDDESGNFTKMNDFELGSHPSAAMTYIEDIKKKAIIVVIKGKVYFYDFEYDSWIEASNSWIHPVATLERVKLFISHNR